MSVERIEEVVVQVVSPTIEVKQLDQLTHLLRNEIRELNVESVIVASKEAQHCLDK